MDFDGIQDFEGSWSELGVFYLNLGIFKIDLGEIV